MKLTEVKSWSKKHRIKLIVIFNIISVLGIVRIYFWFFPWWSETTAYLKTPDGVEVAATQGYPGLEGFLTWSVAIWIRRPEATRWRCIHANQYNEDLWQTVEIKYNNNIFLFIVNGQPYAEYDAEKKEFVNLPSGDRLYPEREKFWADIFMKQLPRKRSLLTIPWDDTPPDNWTKD